MARKNFIKSLVPGLSHINNPTIYRVMKEVRMAPALNFSKNYILQQRRIQQDNAKGLISPTSMHIEMTRYCEKRCNRCPIPVEDRQNEHVIDISVAKRAAERGRSWGISIFNFMGGEPVNARTVPIMNEILTEYASKSFLCCTNSAYGSKATKDFEEMMMQDNLSFVLSLDGFEGKNDGLRGKGSYRDTLELARLLKSRRCFFGSSTTPRESNYEEATSEEFIDHLIKNGFSYVLFSIPKWMYKEEIGERLEKHTDKPIFIYGDFGPLNERSDYVKSRDVYVATNGDIYPDRMNWKAMGNLEVDSDFESLRSNPLWMGKY